MLHKLAIVAFYELENLANPESCASFLGSIEGIRQMAGSWFVAKPNLRMIELYTEKIDMPVPYKAKQIFAFNHDEPWVHDGVGQVLKIFIPRELFALKSMVVDWTICSLTWKEKDMSMMKRMREMIIPAVGIWG
jgi:hypothetical protein